VIRGSFTNVVGLPMERLAGLLRDYHALMRADKHVASHESSLQVL
jgi:hypothetical protein